MSNEPIDPSEADAQDGELVTMLLSARSVPSAGFRGALRRRLAARDPGYGPRPPRLHLMTAAFVSAGAFLIGLGALAATGIL